MLLGRSTVQWVGLISALLATIQTVVLVAFPEVDGEQVALILGAIGSVLGVLVAFIANTSTTPVNDPQLKQGTQIRITDESGTVIGNAPVPRPE
jgi:uncharacterized membrane protein